MRNSIQVIAGLFLGVVMPTVAGAQSSSLGGQRRREKENSTLTAAPTREQKEPKANPAYEKYSWVTTPAPPPRSFKVHDLVTVIVRQQLQFKSGADLKTKNDFDIKSQIEAFFKPTRGGLGDSKFTRGKPNVDYKFETEIDKEGDTQRKDSLTTRMTARIIDVKPNGLLVLEGRASLTHGEEVSRITITGSCRKEDVTADNSVLSTQLADVNVMVANEGALAATARRGWIPKVLDTVRPF